MHYFTGFSPRVNRVEIKTIQLLSQKLQLTSYLGGKNNSPAPWKKTNKICKLSQLPKYDFSCAFLLCHIEGNKQLKFPQFLRWNGKKPRTSKPLI